MTNQAIVGQLVLLGLFVGNPTQVTAGEGASSTTTSTIAREAGEAVQATSDYAIQQKVAFQKKVQSELDERQRQIATLKTKTNQASGKARAELNAAIGQLEKQKNAAHRKLEELTASSASSWNHLKSGMNEALQDLKNAYKRTLSHLP